MTSNLIRWGGLAAMVAAALFIIADLLALFVVSFQGPTDGIIFEDVVAAGAGALLLLGLVALYGRRLEVMGLPGLVGFLVTFVGMVLALGAFIWSSSLADRGWVLFFIWSSLLANLGWILFGALCLEDGACPRATVILLIAGAVLYGVANALIGSGAQSGALGDNPTYVVGVVAFDVVFNAAIAWLGFSLFRRRRGGVQQPTNE